MKAGARVQIFLTTGHQYSGKVLSEDEIFLVICDRFGERVSLNKKDIQVIREAHNYEFFSNFNSRIKTLLHQGDTPKPFDRANSKIFFLCSLFK